MLSLIRRLRDWTWEAHEPATSACDSQLDVLDGSVGSCSPDAWEQLCQDNPHRFPRSEATQRLVRRGVPAHMRAEVWRRCVDACNHPHFDTPPSGYYSQLLSRSDQGVEAAVCKQIDKDLHRTFGSVQGVRVPQQEALSSLRNVLMAYAVHNPEVGYCQSMNFIAAVLLLIVDEELAFWCLSAVVERMLPGHFTGCMVMSLVDQGVLRELLWAEDPKLMSHFEQLQARDPRGEARDPRGEARDPRGEARDPSRDAGGDASGDARALGAREGAAWGGAGEGWQFEATPAVPSTFTRPPPPRSSLSCTHTALYSSVALYTVDHG